MLDHAGLIGTDLDRLAERLGQLGFALTPRVDHTRPGDDGGTVPLGSAQRCAMFEHGYIEVMAVHTRGLGHPLEGAAERYEGAHIVALAATDAEADAQALRDRGVAASAVARWQRPTEAGMARFAFFDTDRAATPEGMVCWVQQLTPDALRPAGSTEHPNTARALRSLVLCSADPRGTAERYGTYTGATVTHGPAGSTVDDGDDTIEVVDAEAFAARYPGQVPVGPECVAAIVVEVADLGQAATVLEAGGVPVHHDGGCLWVPAAPGAHVVFELRAGT